MLDGGGETGVKEGRGGGKEGRRRKEGGSMNLAHCRIGTTFMNLLGRGQVGRTAG